MTLAVLSKRCGKAVPTLGIGWTSENDGNQKETEGDNENDRKQEKGCKCITHVKLYMMKNLFYNICKKVLEHPNKAKFSGDQYKQDVILSSNNEEMSFWNVDPKSF